MLKKALGLVCLLVLSGTAVAQEDHAKLAKDAMDKAGIDFQKIRDNIKEAACADPNALVPDGVTLSIGKAFNKGPFLFGLGAEYALFVDLKNNVIKGQLYVIPQVGIGKATAGIDGVQLGVTFGCQGNPRNYEGYFASASMFGLSLNLGISDDVFTRIGAKLAGVNLQAGAPKNYDQLVKDFREATVKAKAAMETLKSLDGFPGNDRSAFNRNWKFNWVTASPTGAGVHSITTLPHAMGTFLKDQAELNKGSEDILQRVSDFRKSVADASTGDPIRRKLAIPNIRARYLMESETLVDSIWNSARFVTQLLKYAPNNSVKYWVFGPKRFSEKMEKYWPNPRYDKEWAMRKVYYDDLTGFPVSKERHDLQKRQMAAAMQLFEASQKQVDAMNGLNHILNNDEAGLRQGQAFQAQRKVGGLPQADRTFSGCNSVTVDPQLFMKSGGRVLTAVGELYGRMIAQGAMSLSQVQAQLINPQTVRRLASQANLGLSNATPAATLSHYFTPADLSNRLGIDVTPIVGNGEFSLPLPAALRDLGNRAALCAPEPVPHVEKKGH